MGCSSGTASPPRWRRSIPWPLRAGKDGEVVGLQVDRVVYILLLVPYREPEAEAAIRRSSVLRDAPLVLRQRPLPRQSIREAGRVGDDSAQQHQDDPR